MRRVYDGVAGVGWSASSGVGGVIMAALKAKQPTNRKQRGLWQQHIEDKFERFDEANPWVWGEILRQAQAAFDAGEKRHSMKDIWEDIRKQVGHGSPLRAGKLDNNFTSRFARKLKRERPDLAAMFEMREIKAA